MYRSDDKVGQLKTKIAQQLPDLAPLPAQKFGLIAVDPPWLYSLRESDKTHRNRCPYPPMTDQQILDLPVGDLADKDAYLLLWVTNNHMELAFECCRRWGFTQKSIHTWVKMTNDGSRIRFGAGHWGRNCTEHFLVASRGKASSWLNLGLTSWPNVIFAPRSEQHSEKPELFYQLCDQVAVAAGYNKIELFARKARPDWVGWGLECPQVVR